MLKDVDTKEKFLKVINHHNLDFELCWDWQGFTDGNGYGNILLDNKGQRKMGSHRLSYQLFYNDILNTSDIVCHRCDNPICVNPHHLFKGNRSINTTDHFIKQRFKRNKIKKLDKIMGLKWLIEHEYQDHFITKITGIELDKIKEFRKILPQLNLLLDVL